MDPVSCVSCVSRMYSVYAAETHETFHRESGMRYQSRLIGPIHARIGPFICLRGGQGFIKELGFVGVLGIVPMAGAIRAFGRQE